MISTDSALYATTKEVHLAEDAALLNLLPHTEPTGVWLRAGHGMIGLGVAASNSAAGPDRFAQLSHWWEALTIHDGDHGTAKTTGATGDAGPTAAPTYVATTAAASTAASPADGVSAGPVAFTTITYSAASADVSQMVVPQLLIRSTERGAWLTIVAPQTTGFDELLTAHGLSLKDSVLSLLRPTLEPPKPATQQHPGVQTSDRYLNAVTEGISAIEAGTVEKLVLARDMLITAEDPLPVGGLLATLAADYPDCWTYRVANVLGATPEMLVSLRGEHLFSRVLAGTLDHRAEPQHRRQAQSSFLTDTKQRREHQLAVDSLLDQLGPVTESLQPSAEPEVLELPNVYHLATDITGQLARDQHNVLPSPLTVAEHAHPTAAVCGTPTKDADQLLSILEGLDRGPFAGPVGWIDRHGNADFGIALRGGVLEDSTKVRLYAGCGVVVGSEPESELAETSAKLRVMRSALGA